MDEADICQSDRKECEARACGSEKEGSVLESAAPGQERADKFKQRDRSIN